MGQFDRSAACLRLFGDDLDPAAMTALLGCEPSSAETRGDIIRSRSGRERVAPCGRWFLDAAKAQPEDLAGQIRWLLDQLTDDLELWARLGKDCDIDMSCGLFMAGTNDGCWLPADVLLMLGQRGIALNLDVYGGADSEAD